MDERSSTGFAGVYQLKKRMTTGFVAANRGNTPAGAVLFINS
jgi:hypothetical protein